MALREQKKTEGLADKDHCFKMYKMSLMKSLKYIVLDMCAGQCRVLCYRVHCDYSHETSITSNKFVVFLIILIWLLCITHCSNVSLSSTGLQAAPWSLQEPQNHRPMSKLAVYHHRNMRGLWVNVWFVVCKLSLQLMQVKFSVTCSQVLEQTSLDSLQMVVVTCLLFECLHNDNPLNHLSVFA